MGYTTDVHKELKFKQIKNNIDEFIGLDQFKKSADFSVRDLRKPSMPPFIFRRKKNDCWNTSILWNNEL